LIALFALVHGGWHGSWCWERIVPELEARGHDVVTMDLPSDDPAATFEDHADVVAATLAGQYRQDVVVVGHSMGGLAIPLVPARAAVAKLIYLCALVPVPGISFLDQVAKREGMLAPGHVRGLGEVEPGKFAWVDRDLARFHMYGDCDTEDAALALDRLRPLAQQAATIPCVLRAFPDPPRAYIVCSDDELVMPEWSRRVAGPRLDAQMVEMPGSHSPFWSRPSDLAAILDALA
jgi:pimeloyl-ACP methyl ester carboxylesterase